MHENPQFRCRCSRQLYGACLAGDVNTPATTRPTIGHRPLNTVEVGEKRDFARSRANRWDCRLATKRHLRTSSELRVTRQVSRQPHIGNNSFKVMPTHQNYEVQNVDKHLAYCDACETWVWSDEAWLRDTAKHIASGRWTMNWDICWYKVANDEWAPPQAHITADFVIGNHDRRGQVLRAEALNRASSSRVYRESVEGKSVFCIGSLYHESTCHYGAHEGDHCDPRVWAVQELLEQIGYPWG